MESGRRSDGIAGIPLDRWDAEAEALRTGDDASLVRRFGGYMRNVDMFDASCFGVSSAEAVLMDPQLLLLRSCPGAELLPLLALPASSCCLSTFCELLEHGDRRHPNASSSVASLA